MSSKYFSDYETQCHCGCGGNIINPLLLEKLDTMREMIGGPIYLAVLTDALSIMRKFRAVYRTVSTF